MEQRVVDADIGIGKRIISDVNVLPDNCYFYRIFRSPYLFNKLFNCFWVLLWN